MKAEIVKKWTDALRSGEYKQGHGALHTVNDVQGERFCCLGVLCSLFTDEHETVNTTVENGVVYYGRNTATLPHRVQAWVGLRTSAGEFGDEDENALTALNDDGHSFEEIADIIESNPEGLF